MGRIVERLRAVGARRATLFLVVTAAVAVGFYFGVQEAGVGPRSVAQQDDSATTLLTLTLSAAEICETTPAQGYSGAAMVWNEETQDWGVKSYKTGYDDVGETAVTWSVGGGTAPYTLVIDGETRDAEQTYAGPSGTASVSCAMQLGETFITDDGSRRHRTEPEVDSGLKTIRATVTDGAGATAEASVDVYVILALDSSGDILQGGKTYRVMGKLLTVPEALDYVILGGIIEGRGGPWLGIGIAGVGWVLVRRGNLREHSRSTRSADAGDGDVAVGPSETELDALIDDLMESVGRAPSIGGESP